MKKKELEELIKSIEQFNPEQAARLIESLKGEDPGLGTPEAVVIEAGHLIAHCLPKRDTGLTHVLSVKCECAPLVERLDNGHLQVTHELKGTDPEGWMIQTIDRRDK
jgi:hypothetical protein